VGGRLHPLEVQPVHPLDVLEDLGQLGGHAVELLVAEPKACQPGDMEDLVAVDHGRRL
jgi:hypothetical protein